MKQLPNVRIHEHREKGCDVNEARLDPFLHRIVERLALAKPNWTFTVNTRWATPVKRVENEPPYFQIRSLNISEGSSILGVLGMDSIYRKGNRTNVFTLANKRIRDSRERGSRYETIKEESAYKEALRQFRRDSANEVLEAAISNAKDAVDDLMSHSERQYRQARNLVLTHLDHYVDEHMKEIEEHFIKNSAGNNTLVTSLHDLPKLKNDLARCKKLLMSTVGKNEGYLVVIHDGKYLVKHLDTVQLYDDTTLPEHLKRNVGLLKLSDKGVHIESIGIKTDTEVFVIEPQGETQ